MLPDISPPALGSFSPKDVAVVVAKLASSPSAAASSLRVSNAAGAVSTIAATAVSTYAVVAILVELFAAV